MSAVADQTVWVLMTGEMHEGGDIVGIFATRDLARGHVASTADQLPFDLDGARQEADGSIHLTAGCDWLSLTPHTVACRPAVGKGR